MLLLILLHCSLTFYALKIMPAYTYTIMCNLKIITTGVLGYVVLDKHLTWRAVASLAVLFGGVCVGQYSPAPLQQQQGGSPSPAAAPSPAADVVADSSGDALFQQLTSGVVVMVVIAVLSAVAAVYSEWVMNFSSFKHESLNLQNLRLYVAGTLLNGLYYLQSGGSFSSFLVGMKLSHWAVVLVLAVMGLVTVSVRHRMNGVTGRSAGLSLCSQTQTVAKRDS